MGKTTAINQAFSSADKTSEVLVMTDVDARLDPGSIRRLGAWFTNPEIGAVGGTPNRCSVVNKTHVSSELSYRGMFTLQRIGESERDSTPFLEGSILGIRRSVFSEGVLDLNCNADDAQLAVATRLSGLRAIQDRDLIFRDSIAPTYAEHRAQKIRRGQGLQRLLWRHRRHWFSRKQGAWGNILGTQAIMHLIVPWLVLIGTVFAILKWCMIIANPVSLGVFVTATLILDSWVFGSWPLFRIGARVPLISLPATFLDSMSALLVSQFKLLSGESLHMWEQGEGARKAMDAMKE